MDEKLTFIYRPVVICDDAFSERDHMHRQRISPITFMYNIIQRK